MDADGKKLLINTEAWKRIYSLVMEGYKNGVLQWTYSPENKTRYDKEDVEAEDLFSAGRAAMTISNFGQISGLKQRAPRLLGRWQMRLRLTRIEAKTSNELPVRKKFAKEADGHSLEPFYRVTYDETVQGGYNENIPLSFGETYRTITLKQVDSMMKGSVSVEQGMKLLQEKGQQALDEAWAAEVE